MKSISVFLGNLSFVFLFPARTAFREYHRGITTSSCKETDKAILQRTIEGGGSPSQSIAIRHTASV